MTANLFLVGMMGAGKTTVGRHLARRLNRRFIDADHELEARTGVRIPVIFDIEGEAGFREREAKLLGELCRMEDVVVATGGGVVLREDNRKLLRLAGKVMYLHAPPELLYERTRLDGNRPLLQVADPLGRLRDLYELRDPLYREVADIVIDSPAGSVGALVKRVEKEVLRPCAP